MFIEYKKYKYNSIFYIIMNLQESCYLELYNHVYEEIHKKNVAQTKIRKWWYFVNNDKDIAIVRTCKSNGSFMFNLYSIICTHALTLTITDVELGCDNNITFVNSKQMKTYLLHLILRSQYLFKIYIQVADGYITDGVCLQIFE